MAHALIVCLYRDFRRSIYILATGRILSMRCYSITLEYYIYMYVFLSAVSIYYVLYARCPIRGFTHCDVS